ncbi:MAG: type IV pilus assembly protein PilM [Candidatus Omnitrophica bacterium]|nr:type IV pilus assembly protein PilM [Candidatus Omnitrophota bacterium]
MQLSDLLKGSPISAHTRLGLDIGNFSVKIAQIKKKNFGKEKMLSFAVVPVKDAGTPENVIRAIKEACKEVAADSKKVNISVCGPNIIMHYIILPLMQEKDLAQSLDFELERYVPFKRENSIIDYHILANLANNQMLVLLVGAERHFIQERIKLVRDAGLEPQLINLDAFALMDAFLGALPAPNSPVALLDIGYHLSKLVVMEDDVPYFSRDIETGERDVFQTIADKMSIDLGRAQDFAYSPPEDKIKEIAEAIKPAFNNLLNELSLSFEYCERNLEKKVSRLYLSGGGSKIKVLVDFLAGIQDLKIDIWDPILGMKLSPSISAEDAKQYAHILPVAIGLAFS